MDSTGTIDLRVEIIHTYYEGEMQVPPVNDATNLKVYAGTTLGVQTTSQHISPPILPLRFNSISQPSPRSIVLPELNSVSEPKAK